MENGAIFKQIPKVMAEIGAIGKERENSIQKYSFRGIDDVYNAVHAALAKNGVFCTPIVESIEREERKSKNGGLLLYTVLKMKYLFYAEDGSYITLSTVGEAMDSSDKSCNKAMSAAQKYAFFQLFCIPTEEPKDTENDNYEPEKKTTPQPTQGKKPKPEDVEAKAKAEKMLKEIGLKIGVGEFVVFLGVEGYETLAELMEADIDTIRRVYKKAQEMEKIKNAE